MMPSLSQPTTAGDGERQALEACLLDHPLVRDCALLQRTTPGGVSLLVAYVATSDEVSLDDLRQHARAAGTALLPSALVRITTLPVRDDGGLDEKALLSLPVIEPGTIRRCDALIRATGSLTRVETVREWHRPDLPELRVDELLPDAAGGRDPGPVPGAPAIPGAPPSISVGEPIRFAGRRPRDLPELLLSAAERQPTHGVTCVEQDGDHSLTYPELCDRAARIMAGLRAVGLRPGDPAIFQLERNLDVIAAFWGCLFGGFVSTPIPVPAVPDLAGPAAARLKNTWQLLGRPLVVTSAEREAALADLARGLGLSGFRAVSIETLLQGEAGEGRHQAGPEDLALLLLTSGSTGMPKAVTQTHGALIDASAAMAQQNGFSDRHVSLNWISLDHGGGIIMCHLMPVALASRQVHARTEYVLQDILRWLDLIERHRATFTWAPNFAFALVNGRGEEIAARRWDLSSMAFVLNGGEAVVSQTARRFLRLLAPHRLPQTAMRPAWGMAETSSAATFSSPLLPDSTSDSDRVVEVGPPDPGFGIRIVDDRSNVVPEGAEGRLEVHGSVVTRGYLNNPEANAESFSGDGWFRTGDLGRIRQGRLTITGREKGVIIINGVNYYAHEVEAAVEDVPGVTPSFTAAFAARQPGADTDALVVAFHTPHTADADIVKLAGSIRSSVSSRVGIAPGYLLPVRQDEIPKTSIGKIQRAALARRFEQGGFAAEMRRLQALSQPAETVPDWFYRPVWLRRQSASHLPVGRGTTVVMIPDRSGLAVVLEPLLRESGARPVCIERDAELALSSSGTAGLLGSAELQRALDGIPLDERLVVLDGRGYGARSCSHGFDEGAAALAQIESIVALAQALEKSGHGRRRFELFVYDEGVQRVVPGDRACCWKAPALALLRTVSQENPGTVVRHVDLPHARPEALAPILLAELADRRVEPEVAYREGGRWVRRLEKRPAYPSPRGHRLGRGGGFYLITGGLGGISAEVCSHLLRTSDSPLLLVDRRPVTDGTDARRERLSSLEGLGTVHFEALDVADPEALDAAVGAAVKRWGRPLGGVLHLAGVFEPRLLSAETSETLAAACSAKVRGAWNIHRLLMRYPEAVLVAFSSVNGYMGGYGAGAYAAANAFLDGLVRHHVEDLGRTAYSLGWSIWDNVGMSRTHTLKEAAERAGYRAVPVKSGIVSLVAATGSEPGHVLIGLDGGNPHAACNVAGSIVSDGLTACWVRSDEPDAPLPPSLEDSFGVPVSCRVREIAESGRAPATDAAAWQSLFGNDVERAVASVWREALPSGRIGRDDNFFDAGANSLLVATASRKLGQVLGREVPMTDIYRFPTVRLLAAHCAGTHDADAVALDDSEARGQARRTKRLQRRQRNA